MSRHDPDEINRLIGRFSDLQEQWESAPQAFDWTVLQALARESALAYNEGAGPSFHSLALDGVRHTEFHERYLAYSLEAGFDPFKIIRAGPEGPEIPVIDHASLAEEAMTNPESARMRASLIDLARAKFGPLVQEGRSGEPDPSDPLYQVAEVCGESMPGDLLEKIAPELARSHREKERRQMGNPVEGYLSNAELSVDDRFGPYG
jgi:hypothetical protein